MKKIVSESLNLEERWVSSDTGVHLYADEPIYSQEDMEEITDETISNMVPPPEMKLSVEEFDGYVNSLIEIMPENPGLAYRIFQKTVENHPYLLRRESGFKGGNPYELMIKRFQDKLSDL